MTRRRQRGYTAVEVLVAMTLFAIGAAGVIGMLKVTVQGGQDARRMDIATNIAHQWIDRLQRDAMFWTQPNAAFPGVDNLNQTVWLRDVNSAACNAGYCNPTFTPVAAPQAEGAGWAFDFLGRDRWNGSTDDTGQPDHEYCVQYRLNWIYPLGNPPTLNQQAVMRAEIRVFYGRLEGTRIGSCNAPAVDPNAAAAASTYHFVHATTAIREYPR